MTTEQEDKLRRINIENNKSRFESLGKKGQEAFYLSLLKPDPHNGKALLPDQARKITEKFKSGEAGSVEEALTLLQQEEFDDRNTHR